MGIVTDGLIGYWHYKQGVNGNTWENIAPNTIGQYNGAITGATLQEEAVYFDGVDDIVTTTDFPTTSAFTIEVIAKYTNDAQYTNFVPISYYSTTTIRGALRLSTQDSSRSFLWSDNQGSFTQSPTRILTKDAIMHYTVTIGSDRNTVLYLNGVKQTELIIRSMQRFGGKVYFGVSTSSGATSYPFEGHLYSTKVYNRALTVEEVQQNYSVENAIGLEDTPVITIPSVSITNINKNKLSNSPDMDRTNITFSFDTDVTEWVVRVLGSSHDTGTIADSGGSVLSNTEITAEIDWTELYQEGENRVNIYGRNSNGEWTLYSE